MDKGNCEKSLVSLNIKQQSKFMGTVGRKSFEIFLKVVDIAYRVKIGRAHV
jgi:hypothetical protein